MAVAAKVKKRKRVLDYTPEWLLCRVSDIAMAVRESIRATSDTMLIRLAARLDGCTDPEPSSLSYSFGDRNSGKNARRSARVPYIA